MRPLPDALQDELRTALRRALHDVPPRGDVHDLLGRLGLHGLEIAPAAGGLGLGLSYGVVVAEELGRVAACDTYRSGCLAAETGPSAAAEVAGGARPPAVAPPPAGGALVRARIRQAGYLVGLAAGAHELAVRRSGERRQFGRPIAAFQATGFILAADLVHIEEARLLTAYAAWLADRDTAGIPDSAADEPCGWPPADGEPELAAIQALAAAAEAATGVTRRALHLHGTYGLTGDAAIQHYYRLAGTEATSLGRPAALWRAAGHRRLTAGPDTEHTTAVLAAAGKGER
ncbi:acyl-CoA dehydrogenase family protein [Plantactinospora sp. CA-294935]|uniref:acyl-CoA dehydrogenase family protein n=1 Tax=Plantactinospora sp. CA-294935 TaxID=3240012 RepID=UPI003D8FA483